MRSSESVGVYALRLVNLDSRSSRCHDAVRTRTHSCTPEGKRTGVSSSSLSLSPTTRSSQPSPPVFLSVSAPFSSDRTRSLLRSFFSPFSHPRYISVHPLSIRAPPPRRFTYTHARAHTPGLTLSATTTSVLHSKALTSETSASTFGERIYRIFFPHSR